MSNIPKHIGIIMDGNGRWATQRGLARTQGHLEGVKTTKNIVQSASDLGIKYLSLYVFSTENWRRTQEEVGFLMNLITKHLRDEYNFYKENKIRVVHSGDLTGLPDPVQKEIWGVEQDTSCFKDGLTVNLLINYGGRNEIIRAASRLIEKNEKISEEALSHALDQSEFPDLDLIIRTAGEQRLSNFMIWQASYAEYYFIDKLWPDFTREDLVQAMTNYAQRHRRFGANS